MQIHKTSKKKKRIRVWMSEKNIESPNKFYVFSKKIFVKLLHLEDIFFVNLP